MAGDEYEVVIEAGEDSGFGAVCSELSAVSQGATIEEARANIAEAIELVPEDRATKGKVRRWTLE